MRATSVLLSSELIMSVPRGMDRSELIMRVTRVIIREFRHVGVN